MTVKDLKRFLITIPNETKITSLTSSRECGFAIKHVDLCQFVDGSGDPHLVFVPAGTHIPDKYKILSSMGFDGTFVERTDWERRK